MGDQSLCRETGERKVSGFRSLQDRGYSEDSGGSQGPFGESAEAGQTGCSAETSRAAETRYSCHRFHNHHLSQHSQHPSVHRPEDGSSNIWNQDGPGLQTGLSSFVPAGQELPSIFCFLGQAGSEQQQQQQLRCSPTESPGHFPLWASCEPQNIQHTTSHHWQDQPQSHNLCLSYPTAGHHGRRPNSAWHDNEPNTFSIYLCGHNDDQKSNFGSTRPGSAGCRPDGPWSACSCTGFYTCAGSCSSERSCSITLCSYHSSWTVSCGFSSASKTTAGSSQTHYGSAHAANTGCTGREPRSDSGDPGSRPDPGTAANHPPGCNSHPRPWTAANAGRHAPQWSGPAIPLHSYASILISLNFRSHCCYPYKTCPSPDCSNPDVHTDASENPCTSPDDSLILSPNTNDSPSACPNTCCRSNTNAQLSPSPSADPSHSPCVCCTTSCSPNTSISC